MTRPPLKSSPRDVGRGLFYSRDSGGKHEQTPGQYVLWAKNRSQELNVTFRGTAEEIERMMASKLPVSGDLYFDLAVTGNLMSRPALDALKADIQRDQTISHVFIPRRDRLARPDDALDGVLLEKELREVGITLVFMSMSLGPLRRGQRQDMGEAIAAYVDYQQSGVFRDELAEKMIYAQLQLAKAGYSTGGRPPYGFRRFLIQDTGTVIRQLSEGESVRQKGHHVAWLPGPDHELDVIRRVLGLIDHTRASRIAKLLTAENIPSPDAGRLRTDRGVQHAVSGVWHQSMITNLVRNPLLRATTSYGRRSMGDRRRITPEGPRCLEENDYQVRNKKPKVIQNPESQRVSAKAHGDPLLTPERSEQILHILDQRAGTQRGKPRSRQPELNPLGGRIFDMNCCWPMYRVPKAGSFRYLCAFYQQSHGEFCAHNHVDGPLATKFALTAVRQMLQQPDLLSRLRTKLELKTAIATSADEAETKLVSKQNELAALRQRIETAKGNLALAEDADSFRAVEQVFKTLRSQETTIGVQIQKLQEARRPKAANSELVEKALAQIAHLPMLAEDPCHLEKIYELFTRINLQMFLKFLPLLKKKQTVNVLVSGMLTIGNAEPPIQKYSGPTGRRALQSALIANKNPPDPPVEAENFPVSGEGTKSLGNVNRDDRI